MSRSPETPICDPNGACVKCTDNSQCKSQFPIWEACHTEWDGDTQTIGVCVQDTYNKGFNVAAIVLGSVVVFGVILAIIIAIALFVMKKE